MAAMTPEEATNFLYAASAAVKEMLVGVAVTIGDGALALTTGYIGHQQPEFDPLSRATIDGFRHERGFWITGKADLGFTGPDYQPLERSGQMADSYAMEVLDEPGRVTAVVGSPDMVAVYQEMGTNGRYPIPARPVLALGMMTMVPEAVGLLEERGTALLTPK